MYVSTTESRSNGRFPLRYHAPNIYQVYTPFFNIQQPVTYPFSSLYLNPTRGYAILIHLYKTILLTLRSGGLRRNWLIILKLQLLVNVTAQQSIVSLDSVVVCNSLSSGVCGTVGNAIDGSGVNWDLGWCVHACNLDHGRQTKCLGNSADPLMSRLAILGALSNADQSIIRVLLPQQRSTGESLVAILKLDNTLPVRIRVSKLSKAVVKLATILLRNISRLNVLLQDGLHLVATKNKDLGNSDGIEPALDPSPNSAEEGRRANNEYAIQCLGVMCGGKLRSSLHVLLEVPELLEANTGNVDNVGAQSDGDFGVFAVEELSAEGHVETGQVLVERE